MNRRKFCSTALSVLPVTAGINLSFAGKSIASENAEKIIPGHRAAWFQSCHWGVFVHYLAGADQSADDWNRQVDGFDVEGLAEQLASVHALYFCITLGQNSGHFLSPNATYDNIVRRFPSKCSRRDLVADLQVALSRRGIALLVYVPSGAPARDTMACEALEWEWGFTAPHPRRGERTGKRLADFQRKWEAVLREWSDRWGTGVKGWWVDGCYFNDEMYRHDNEPNFSSFAAAMRSGNPDSIVAFNPGLYNPPISATPEEDYTAGEITKLFPVTPEAYIMNDGHPVLFHVLTYLGEHWGNKPPRFSRELVAGYTRHIADCGGVVTWDVGISKNGLIRQDHLDRLATIVPVLGNSQP
ncbi:MAG: hypothetical protein AB7E95_11440 [Kiritimatiellales bacterium]